MDVRLNTDELELLLEALMSRAARRLSMAKASPHLSGMHEEIAADMLVLRARLEDVYHAAIVAYNRGEVAGISS